MSDKLKVMLSTEGTYPFHQGGVSTWCDILVNNITEIDYYLYSIIMNPYVSQKFKLPSNIELIKVPLWGTEEPSEHLSTPFSKVYISKKRTVDSVVRGEFIPLFRDLVSEIYAIDKNPTRFGNILYDLHRYFREFEYKNSFKSEITWNIYKETVMKYTADKDNHLEKPTVYAMIQSLGWVYRFLNILNTPVPDVHVTHSAAAAFCGIPCVLSKLENNTPYLLTEHGVYLREQYLSLSQRGYPSFLNSFFIRFVRSITSLNYAYADQVSPVCNYNTRWEKRFGVEDERINVIYNGVDSGIFLPDGSKYEKGGNKYPTVVSVARIDPLKDIITLIKTAEIVKRQIPQVRFVVYGSVSVPSYFDECMKAVNELDLKETFIFAGHTTDVVSAYRSGDVVALSSISEAFPYSVVEAMMTGKPVVSTDVGGIKEALGDAGILATPRNPEELAEGIIKLLDNEELRNSMALKARERALNYFTIERVLALHTKAYVELAMGQKKEKIVPIKLLQQQKLLLEKGYALMGIGYYNEAINQFRSAANKSPVSPVVPVILTEIAMAYNKMGEQNKAVVELEKASAISQMLNNRETA